MRALRLGLLAIGLCLVSATAQAACTSPPGVEGQFIYSVTNHIPNFCDGSTWRSMVGGQTIYSAGGTTNPVFSAANGYFVLSQGTWSGNLGGLAGADAKCLSDLTANNWNGKSAAQGFGILNSTHVHAWMCTGTVCQDPTANKQYYFATSGDTTAGGSYYTPDSSVRFGYTGACCGTSDGVQWSALSTFNINTKYWSNRVNNNQATGTGAATNNSGYNCTNWTDATNSGDVGSSGASDVSRWYTGTYPNCAGLFHLICLVNP